MGLASLSHFKPGDDMQEGIIWNQVQNLIRMMGRMVLDLAHFVEPLFAFIFKLELFAQVE